MDNGLLCKILGNYYNSDLSHLHLPIVRGYIWICGGTTNPINPTRITLSVREGIENLVVTENF